MTIVPTRRRGTSRAEVFVVVAIVGIGFLILMMLGPRQRETARDVGCRENMRRIGVALAIYAKDQAGRLPPTPDFGPLSAPLQPGPLGEMLETLGYPDFTRLTTPDTAPPRKPGQAPPERRIAGFICTSDPSATSRLWPAPISYRACAGDDTAGTTGAFAVGHRRTMSDADIPDGLEYTAAFSERLVGDGKNPAVNNSRTYTVSKEVVRDPSSCPPFDSTSMSDAGRSWRDSDWRSSYYNHTLLPQGASSCIASDGKTAVLGASSGHGDGVNVLLLSGRVLDVTRRVDITVWKRLANVNDVATAAPRNPPPDGDKSQPEPDKK